MKAAVGVLSSARRQAVFSAFKDEVQMRTCKRMLPVQKALNTRLLCALLLAFTPWAFAASQPSFPNNAWNFVFVPTFEKPTPDSTRLSIEGLNHALLFGQQLTGATAGITTQIRQVYAWSPPIGKKAVPVNDIAILQSIEPFSLLNNFSVNYSQVSAGDAATYNSAASLVSNLLANQPQGIYVIAMPADSINALIPMLPHVDAGMAQPQISNPHQYLVASFANGAVKLAQYQDGLVPKTLYPQLDLTDVRSHSCPQQLKTFSIPKPANSKFQLNSNQTVSFIRHVEAHPTAAFENGNYVCAGQWRALGANKILRDKIGFMPDHILTTNPNDIIACSGTCSYIRPTLTIEPFATEFDRTVEIAQFPWNDAESLAAALFTQNSPFSSTQYQGAKTLVAWEHVHINAAIRYLIGTIYQNPAALKDLPSWDYTDYDSIWTVQIDAAGNLQFSNSCEGIDTALLPSTCPAFTSMKR